MSVLDKLASVLGHRDEAPNLKLAGEIAESGDPEAVAELVRGLSHKQKGIPQDCIKVLYEIGAFRPELISGYAGEFLRLLKSRHNRLQWGAMTALDSICTEVPDTLFQVLPEIIAAAESGSVITRDHAIFILIKLCDTEKYAGSAFALLNEQLLRSPVNQLPMYAERALPIVRADTRAQFVATLQSRLPDLEKASRRSRLEKVIRKAAKR